MTKISPFKHENYNKNSENGHGKGSWCNLVKSSINSVGLVKSENDDIEMINEMISVKCDKIDKDMKIVIKKYIRNGTRTHNP